MLLTVALLLLVLLLAPKMMHKMQAYSLVTEFLDSASGSADLVLEGETPHKAQLDWAEYGDHRIIRAQISGVPFYWCDAVIYLENGKGYDFSDSMPDLSPVLDNPWLLYPMTTVERRDDEYHVELTTQELTILLDLQADSEGLARIGFSDGADLCGSLTLQDREIMQVPQEVLDAIDSGEVQAGQDLTEPIKRLFLGGIDLISRDPLGLELKLTGSMGKEFTLYQPKLYCTTIAGKQVYGLESAGTTFYLTDGKACTADGRLTAELGIGQEAVNLLGIVYQLCLNGELKYEGDVFTLALDQQGMEQLVYAFLPQAQSSNITFSAGSLTVTMKGDQIESIRIACSGSVDLWLVEPEVGVGLDIVTMEEPVTFTVPQAALDALFEDGT